MPSHIAPRPFPKCFDAYLRYAVQTKFDYFTSHGHAPPSVVLLVRLRPGVTIEKFEREFSSFSDMVIGPTKFATGRIQKKQDFLTVRGPLKMVALATWADWEALAWWVTLSMPIVSTGIITPERIDDERALSESNTVIAVIDDGCPFASARLRANAINTNSRVFAIWDQNNRAPVQVGASEFGRRLKDFAYGVEFRRTSTPGVGPDKPMIGIDDWISMHLTPAGQVDEQWCYGHAEFESLRASRSHGAHVLDTLAGSLPTSSGLSFDPKKPPTFKKANDKASKSDVVFVQIPREAVEDPTGGWLDVQVTDALYFIMSCIDPEKTKRVVVNLSYGPTIRPHDGMSNLEYVMSCFTAYFDGKNKRPKLHIVVSAGNSRLSDCHVAFKSTSTKRSATWAWRVPPDNPVPVFTEIWVPKGQEQYVSGTLLAPVPAAPYRGQPPFIARADAPVSNSYGWLIVLPPTAQIKVPAPTAPPSPAPPGQWSFASVPPPPPAPSPASLKNLPPGPHGDWEIQLAFSASNVEAHAYVARGDPNMGARVASKPTRFVDTQWEVKYGPAAAYKLTDGERNINGSLIERKGTLSGVATLVTARFRVAGGYRLRDELPSQYSSRGPSRGGARPGPDYALPSDESLNLLGMRAGGNRNGVAFRLVGTSTAAPQLARHIASPPVPVAKTGNPPNAVGKGILPAP